MPTTTWGLRYPAPTASPAAYQDIQNLANDVQAKTVPRFATTADRNTAIPSPVAGQIAVVAGIVHVHNGTKWSFRRSGTVTMTTDAGALAVFAHGGGQAPTSFQVSPGPQATALLDQVFKPLAWFSDGTNIHVRAARTDSTAYLPSNTVTFNWLADF